MAIEIELGVLKNVVSKLDSSLEKISEVSNSIGKLLAVHDERIVQLEKIADSRGLDIKDVRQQMTTQTREIVEKISALERNIEDRIQETNKISKEQHKEIQDEIQQDVEKLDDRLGVLERWRWYLMGCAAAVGYLSGSADIMSIIAK